MYLRAGLVVWLASLPLLSYARVQTWRSELALWESASYWAPNKIRPEAERARLLHEAGRMDEAEEAYLQAFSRWAKGRPWHERQGCQIVARNIAAMYQSQGQWEKADRWGGEACVQR